MNPFDKPSAKINMAQYIRDIFSDKKSGDSFEIDTMGIKLSNFRAMLYDTIKRTGVSYKTKSVDGKLWVYVK